MISRLVLIGACALIPFSVLAQDEPLDTAPCPKDAACVVYEYPDGDTDTFTLEPNEGIYQEIVIAFVTTTTKYVDGSTVEGDPQALVASFLADEDGNYKLVRERPVPLRGVYKDAELGDSYGPQELRD